MSAQKKRVAHLSREWEAARLGGAIAGSAFLLLCVAAFVWSARGWPLVNDAALMHYVVRLMGDGMAPYREIHDINLPGAYLPEWVSANLARFFHVSLDTMWRGMDALALLLAGWAAVRVACLRSLFAGVWAGSLLALYHGRDGIGQAGQRDLWVAVCLLWAVSSLLEAMRARSLRESLLRSGLFGLFVGAAVAVKPVALPFVLLAVFFPRPHRTRALGLATLGALVPLLLTALFVARWKAWADFRWVLRVALPYHANLGDSPFTYLLRASTISSLGKLLVGLGCVLLLRGREKPSRERVCLGVAVLLGLGCFVAQGKGYPYQRLPYVAFLLLFAATEFSAAVQAKGWWLRAAGAVGLGYGVFLCAPTYLRTVYEARWPTAAVRGLEASILAQAGPFGPRSLEGQVQCIDVASGCTDALLHLGLREATGTLYDEFLFPQSPSPWGAPYNGPPPGAPLPSAVEAGRRRFRAELTVHPPRLVVVSAWLFPQGPGDYEKVGLWPWFAGYLAENYRLASEQDFARSQNGPLGFRLYVRK